ncbi:MAG: histone deacetylase [Candidatus Muproteobacteria bacterium RBG_16_64_11]|uniref:Acetoin utilization protein AcuC n=1 Tax=Candidatus Muproteobacteria bacterium RBG_16_64_11 TaxID=1817758 RepID=A0A1F6TBE8_9PROT|nr:MAG: histone deacetylase [Candidatus Muproteobacteria bacterium RBG_16_64_11]
MRLYYGEALARYGFGAGHPFGADRLAAFWAETQRLGFDRRVQIAAPVSANETELARFHTREYIARVQRQSASGTGFLDDGDTPAFPGVYEAACYVVGSTLDAVAGAVSGDAPRSFVPIAGLHHARRDSAAGFCVFNDIGVAIETLRRVHGIRRIAYVDIDAHHGDGVFYAFEDDPGLIFADLHEDGRYLYPGTGAADETGRGAARGTKLNIPMPPGADDAAFLREWPRVEAFVRAARPEIVLLQAGADCLAGDPITQLCYSPAAHVHATRTLARLADEHCCGRIVALGGGGYNRANLARAWTAVVAALLEA